MQILIQQVWLELCNSNKLPAAAISIFIYRPHFEQQEPKMFPSIFACEEALRKKMTYPGSPCALLTELDWIVFICMLYYSQQHNPWSQASPSTTTRLLYTNRFFTLQFLHPEIGMNNPFIPSNLYKNYIRTYIKIDWQSIYFYKIVFLFLTLFK